MFVVDTPACFRYFVSLPDGGYTTKISTKSIGIGKTAKHFRHAYIINVKYLRQKIGMRSLRRSEFWWIQEQLTTLYKFTWLSCKNYQAILPLFPTQLCVESKETVGLKSKRQKPIKNLKDRSRNKQRFIWTPYITSSAKSSDIILETNLI